MKSGHEAKKLEEKIEFLKAFLESTDFKKLRIQSERYLVEGKKVKFVVCRKEDGLNYEMVVNEESENSGSPLSQLLHRGTDSFIPFLIFGRSFSSH